MVLLKIANLNIIILMGLASFEHSHAYVHMHTDIDECLEGTHNCSQYADCENMHGGFNCK